MTTRFFARTFLFFFLTVLAPATLSAAPFARGADVGWLPQMEAAGIVFRDYEGTSGDCLLILKNLGMDTVRLRVWVNPSDDPTTGHCSPADVVALAVRAQKLGLRIMINFHYSDSWADPKQQTKPAAWKDLPFQELVEAVQTHTREVLLALESAGVTPEWVQIGNEIRGGMLWPDGSTKNFGQLAQLLEAGHSAVKSVNASIKVIIHLDHGHDNAVFRWFFGNLAKHRVSYDVIGLSYYPYWIGSDYTATIDDLGRNLNDLVSTFGKEVMVVEVGGDHREQKNTFDMLAAVIAKVRAVPDGKGIGVLYWEPQSTPSFSKGYLLGCWNEDGTPGSALRAFNH